MRRTVVGRWRTFAMSPGRRCRHPTSSRACAFGLVPGGSPSPSLSPLRNWDRAPNPDRRERPERAPRAAQIREAPAEASRTLPEASLPSAWSARLYRARKVVRGRGWRGASAGHHPGCTAPGEVRPDGTSRKPLQFARPELNREPAERARPRPRKGQRGPRYGLCLDAQACSSRQDKRKGLKSSR